LEHLGSCLPPHRGGRKTQANPAHASGAARKFETILRHARSMISTFFDADNF